MSPPTKEISLTTLATYIAFPGHAKEAFEFYHDVFGGELDLLTFADANIPDMPFPPEAVAHATLSLPGGEIAGGDAMPGEDYPMRGSAYSLLYTTDTPDEARRLIDALVAGGGEVGMPYEPAPWGGYYGQVFDRFGVMWAFSTEA